MNELEIRVQAAYGYVSNLLTRTIDEVANLRAEVAVKDAQLAELRAELEKSKPEVKE